MKLLVSTRMLPLLGALLGIVGGTLFARRLAETPASPETSAIAQGGQAEHRRAARPGAPLAVDGPTFRLLRDMADASEAECEEFVRGCIEEGGSGKALELEIVFRRWLGLRNPEEVRERVSALQGTRPSPWEEAFFNAWLAVDEKGAMSWTSHSLYPAKALHAVRTAREDLADHLRVLDSSSLGNETLLAALTELGRDRPDLVRALKDAGLSGEQKKTAIAAAAAGWAAKDPAAALAWLGSIGKEVAGSEASARVLVEWAKQDPEAAAKAYESTGLDQYPSRDLLLNRALLTLQRPDVAQNQAALAVFANPFTGLAELHRRMTDAGVQDPGYVGPLMGDEAWYPADLAAAARDAEKLPESAARDYVLQFTCHSIAGFDLAGALELAERHGISSGYLDTLRSAPEEEMRQAALADPETTFAALLDPQQVERGSVEAKQLHALVKEWVEREPETASRWLVGLELPEDLRTVDPELAALFSNTLGYHWARLDPVGACAWAADLPEEAMRLQAWQAMHERVAENRPDLAFSMTALLFQGAQRQAVLASSLSGAREVLGMEDARQLLNAAALSDQERAALADTLQASE